jgi:hypothetical protein
MMDMAINEFIINKLGADTLSGPVNIITHPPTAKAMVLCEREGKDLLPFRRSQMIRTLAKSVGSKQ